MIVAMMNLAFLYPEIILTRRANPRKSLDLGKVCFPLHKYQQENYQGMMFQGIKKLTRSDTAIQTCQDTMKRKDRPVGLILLS